ncbi:hypothetical protein EVAR_62377_1 [Eumeta japonica]|uniref:Uncharacterized protein n=1 Tax=Eumeta variegata TaxID=151549 RepID=A0A4C1Z2L7_EUMVA|nr:hypothetical protein EVAR_62377_1 [Eumeta japonica]
MHYKAWLPLVLSVDSSAYAVLAHRYPNGYVREVRCGCEDWTGMEEDGMRWRPTVSAENTRGRGGQVPTKPRDVNMNTSWQYGYASLCEGSKHIITVNNLKPESKAMPKDIV